MQNSVVATGNYTQHGCVIIWHMCYVRRALFASKMEVHLSGIAQLATIGLLQCVLVLCTVYSIRPVNL